METKIIDGRKIRDELLSKIKERVASLSFVPVFCDVLVGDDKVSLQYVEMKAKTALSVGINFHHAKFNKDISSDDLKKEIEIINNIENMCGLIVQLPLPKSIDKQSVCDAIVKEIDVDFLSNQASLDFYSGVSKIGFPTAISCVYMLDYLGLDLSNKNIVVLGQGELVGKPVSYILESRGFVVHRVTSLTEDKEQIIKNADVIISGMGNGKYITGSMIKEGVVIIDAGTSESNSSIVGDVDFDSVVGKARYVSPVPGGVGPVTIAMLLLNVLTVAENK